MPSLSLKKLFKSKKDAASNDNNIKPEKPRTKQTSGTKARIASFTSTFRRRTHLQAHATIEPQSGVVPLPSIPRVASTLRRDLAHFKPLPPILADESDESSGSDSFIDNTNVPSIAKITPLTIYTIRRKPVSSGYASNDRKVSSRSPPAEATIRRKPVPVTEVVNNTSFCARTSEISRIAVEAEEASAIDRISTAGLIHTNQESPSALIIARDAAASRPRSSSSFSSSPSRVISLSEFPLPSALPRIQQTSPPTLYRACTSVQIARQAVYRAPTAVDAQQALIDLADASATNGATTNNDDTTIKYSRDSSGDTMLITSSPPDQGEWDLVENAGTASTPTAKGSHLGYMTRDGRRQTQIIRALQSDKAKAVAENQALTENLAGANAMVRVERAKQEQFRRQFDEAHDAHSQIYNSKLRLAEERDIARSMAEESAAAAETSDDHNKELSRKIAAREYEVCQAKIVLERAQGFKLRTGYSPEEWHDRAIALSQELFDLRNRSAGRDAKLAELTSDLTETAGLLTATTSALAKSQSEAWKFEHLHEEAGRGFAMSQKLHKEANELVGSLQQQIAIQEVTSKVERTCAERLLADAMRENAAKDEHIVRLRNVISTDPEQNPSMPKLLDLAIQHCSESEGRTVKAQRAAEDVLGLLEAEEAMSEGFAQANRELRNELGQFQVELDIAIDEKNGLREELVDVHKELAVAAENARVWQMLAEQRLDELSAEQQAELNGYALGELRKQLEQGQKEVQYYRQKAQTVREDAADLEYDLHLHQRRLANDAGQELFFYQTQWEKGKWIFDENRELKAKLEAFEERFAAELKREPLQLASDPHAHKSFDEAIGPEFIAQSIALVKGQWGAHDPDKPCLTEKVQGLYGFGPAGPPSGRKSVEMPEGYLERKVERQGMEVEGLCQDVWDDAEEYSIERE